MSRIVFFLSLSLFANHVIVIDAGSTGSRLFVLKTAKDLREESTYKEKKAGGIHTVSRDLSKLSLYLDPLIGFAREKLRNEAYQTPIYFRATGGMRSLSIADQKRILKAVEAYFQKEGFKDVSAAVVSGSDEGIYAWIATNYLLNTLTQDSKFETNGVLDMGGASTQITFVPFNTPHQHGYLLTLGKRQYDLYSYSYDGLGMQLGLKSLSSPSCFNYGFQDVSNSQGNIGKCQDKILEVLRESCDFDRASCGLQNVYQPVLRGNFIAIGGFAMLSKVFQLRNYAPSTLEQFGEHLCQMSWEEVRTVYKERDLPQFLSTGCFEMAYYSALLGGDGDESDGYGFTKTADTLSAIEKIDNQTISIAFGVAVYETLGGKITPLSSKKMVPTERPERDL